MILSTTLYSGKQSTQNEEIVCRQRFQGLINQFSVSIQLCIDTYLSVVAEFCAMLTNDDHS